MRFKILILVLSTVGFFFLSAPSVLAGGCNVGPVLPPCVCLDNCNLADLVYMVMNFIRYALGLLSVVSIFLFVQGGLNMILARGHAEKIETAKKMISGTVIGMFFALISWTLINTIVVGFTGNPQGILFQGQPNQAPWWQLQYTQACPSGYSCIVPDASNPAADTCRSGPACPANQECCQ